ncbi:hypothetical protein H2200_009067 [Cladophialophora chaetospira]|uniref:PLL-like beta propeller domain-containing protein n=1 Tax=Cladophialophora chaetospira TaxID=386627 RepID=A0AA38X3M6_9EURO|nr:hypothetical protein H2200_009067 [Cladophialophora chaetospira]
MSRYSSDSDGSDFKLEVIHAEKTENNVPALLFPRPAHHAQSHGSTVDQQAGIQPGFILTKGNSPEVWVTTTGVEQITQRKKAGDARRKKRVIVLVVGVLVAVAAVVGGVVGGLLSKHSKSKSSPGSSQPSSPASGTGGASPTMSGPAIALASYAFPTAVSWGYPHLEVFAVNSSVIPAWKYRQLVSPDSETSEWVPSQDTGEAFTSLGGFTEPAQFGIAATTRNGTDVDIFTWSTDESLRWKHHGSDMSWDPSPTSWKSLANVLLGPPAVVSWAADRLDVFVINIAYGLSQIWWTVEGGWHEWSTFTSQYSWLTYAPTVVSWAEGRLDVFLVGAEDQALYHRYFDEEWQPADFEKLGGFCTSRPVAVSREEGEIDLVVRGGDAGLWYISFSQDGSTGDRWSNWTSISGNVAVQGEPEVIADGPSYLQVFAWGVDNQLLHKSYNAQTESWAPGIGFETLGEGLAGPPKAVYDGRGIHVFAYLQDAQQLGRKSWDAASNTWSPGQGFELLGSVE